MSFIGPVKKLFHQITITPGFNLPGYEKGAEHDHGIETPETDTFEEGAWWKNKAVSVGVISAGEEKCACSRCSSCVSVLYEIQSTSLTGTISPDKAEEKPAPDIRDEVEEDAAAQGKKEMEMAGDEMAEDGLGLQQQMALSRLKSIDAAVRAHERAHVAVGGGLIRGGVSYQYRVGPDGKRYAVGGDVAIDTSEGVSPEATIRKMEAVRSAALAPATPSAQDRRVAAQAALAIIKARIELLNLARDEATQIEEGEGSLETENSNIAESA
ncbi:MAG: hypothetical protein KKG47_13855 [Proteobacteria bacterium]|nr:hypothetical protein [Pseudomonadota bacterium]MBU1739094.1 hypothetical protein [Pseudomonadota bacterium]